ncbi:hypothetical protein VISI1226_04552 [Vibrio sinaloensis DSM 21326]|uniref:Uncharacterized protein n=1 Tax=Vibrio sinaloensis DSM 21326 TaxID=945550 RepID=E8M407_PHOS4|nr:hypothetical protein VISI1226_04552 [Vibrio sinaloensis DSM 21326]
MISSIVRWHPPQMPPSFLHAAIQGDFKAKVLINAKVQNYNTNRASRAILPKNKTALCRKLYLQMIIIITSIGGR